jgi:polyhydroxyalkanoate synthase
VYGDPTWREHPVFRRLAQTQLAWAHTVERMVERSDGEWPDRERARYLAKILTATLTPANFLLTNPVALKRAIDTGGRSVLPGARNLLRDVVTNRGMPSMVDTRPYQVGVNLACTPGAVVHREEMFEVLQYSPATDNVRERPLIVVPPELNRYYVLDLAPSRSLVEFAVSNGVHTFMVVWRNPRKHPSLGHGRWGMEDYVAAHTRAFDVVRELTWGGRPEPAGSVRRRHD